MTIVLNDMKTRVFNRNHAPEHSLKCLVNTPSSVRGLFITIYIKYTSLKISSITCLSCHQFSQNISYPTFGIEPNFLIPKSLLPRGQTVPRISVFERNSCIKFNYLIYWQLSISIEYVYI